MAEQGQELHLAKDSAWTVPDGDEHVVHLTPPPSHHYLCPRCGFEWDGQDPSTTFTLFGPDGHLVYSEAIQVCYRCMARDARQRYGLIVDGVDSREEVT